MKAEDNINQYGDDIEHIRNSVRQIILSVEDKIDSVNKRILAESKDTRTCSKLY